ncbi:hypothetical protein D3C80_1952660 [compost metagenome]
MRCHAPTWNAPRAPPPVRITTNFFMMIDLGLFDIVLNDHEKRCFVSGKLAVLVRSVGGNFYFVTDVSANCLDVVFTGFND